MPLPHGGRTASVRFAAPSFPRIDATADWLAACTDANSPTTSMPGVEKRAAGKAVVHRRGRADHLIDGPAASRRQRPANHGYDARAAGDRVAPRARDGERQVANTRGRGCRRDGGRVEPGHAEDGQPRRGIPAGKLGLQRRAVMPPDTKPIVAPPERTDGGQHHAVRIHEAAGGTPSPLYLDHGNGRGIHGIRQLIREGREQIVRHAAIVAEGWAAHITQTGEPWHNCVFIAFARGRRPWH